MFYFYSPVKNTKFIGNVERKIREDNPLQVSTIPNPMALHSEEVI